MEATKSQGAADIISLVDRLKPPNTKSFWDSVANAAKESSISVRDATRQQGKQYTSRNSICCLISPASTNYGISGAEPQKISWMVTAITQSWTLGPNHASEKKCQANALNLDKIMEEGSLVIHQLDI